MINLDTVRHRSERRIRSCAAAATSQYTFSTPTPPQETTHLSSQFPCLSPLIQRSLSHLEFEMGLFAFG
jgi:hypothetical protein